jgi:hypothetical protein
VGVLSQCSLSSDLPGWCPIHPPSWLGGPLVPLLAAMEQQGTNLPSPSLTDDKNIPTVPSLLSLLEANLADRDRVADVMKSLNRLCIDDSLSRSIASSGMHLIVAAIDRHSRDPDCLAVAVRLLGHLAFVDANLPAIIRHKGIQKVIHAITSHPDSQGLMVRCIQTLDTIAMANKEAAAVVIDEGGRELVETIKDAYPENFEIAKASDSVLLSVSALAEPSRVAAERRNGKEAARRVVVDDDDEGPKDPLHEYRALLKAGKVLKVWHRGSAAAAHVLCSPDFRAVVWQEVRPPQKKLGALDLRAATGVRLGSNKGHTRGFFSIFSKSARADCTFTILTDNGSSLDFEASSPEDADTWTKAIALLLKLFRENPRAL